MIATQQVFDSADDLEVDDACMAPVKVIAVTDSSAARRLSDLMPIHGDSPASPVIEDAAA